MYSLGPLQAVQERLKKHFRNRDFWPITLDPVQIHGPVLELDWSGNQGWKIVADRNPKVTKCDVCMYYNYTLLHLL